MPAKNPIPTRKTVRPAAPPSVARRLGAGAGSLLRLIGTPIAARPATSAGIATFAVLSALVSVNAFYGQPGRHPRPMMATRGQTEATPASASEDGNDGDLMPVPLVLEVQSALASTGHYRAAVDGRPGPATTAAIRAFQSEHGLQVDGEPSPQLLSQIRRMSGAAPSASDRPSDAVRTASIEDRMRTSGAADEAVDAGQKTNDAHDRNATGSVDADERTELVRRIQAGLAAADVAELKADGIIGEQTRAAIRTFEARQGLDVTGKPDERILKRLIKIGALK